MPDVRSLAATSSRIVVSVDEALTAGDPVLVLFDEGLDAVHDHFLEDFGIRRDARDYLLVWRGETVASKEAFYDECVRAMPGCASYFGRNLDALHEVLTSQGIGLAEDPADRTFWVWRNAHGLFVSDPEFFRKLYAATVEDAGNVNQGRGLGGIGGIPFPPQRVSFLLTGRWDAMKEPVQNGDSFLHVTRWWQYRPQPPPEPTGLAIFHISK